MRFLQTDSGKFRAMAYSPDGRQIVSGHGGGWLRLWDCRRAELVAEKQSKPVVLPNLVSFLSDGEQFLVAYSWGTSVWRIVTNTEGIRLKQGRKLRPFGGFGNAFDQRGGVTSIPDGPCVLGTNGRYLQEVNVEDDTVRKFSLTAANDHLRGVALHPDGHTLATVASTGPIDIWDRRELKPSPSDSNRSRSPGKPVVRLNIPEELDNSDARRLCFGGGGGERLAYCAGGRVAVWDTATWEIVTTFAVTDRDVRAAEVSPTDRLILAATTDREVRAFDLDTGAERGRFAFDVGRINRLAFAPDGMTAAACGGGKRLVIWDID